MRNVGFHRLGARPPRPRAATIESFISRMQAFRVTTRIVRMGALRSPAPPPFCLPGRVPTAERRVMAVRSRRFFWSDATCTGAILPVSGIPGEAPTDHPRPTTVCHRTGPSTSARGGTGWPEVQQWSSLPSMECAIRGLSSCRQDLIHLTGRAYLKSGAFPAR